MGHICEGIGELLFGKRTARPICKARAFIEINLEAVFNERAITRAIAEPNGHACNLCVEDWPGYSPANAVKNFHILPRRMQNFRDVLVEQQVF